MTQDLIRIVLRVCVRANFNIRDFTEISPRLLCSGKCNGRARGRGDKRLQNRKVKREEGIKRGTKASKSITYDGIVQLPA